MHLDVRDHQVEPVRSVDELSGSIAGAGLDHLEPFVFQGLDQDEPNQLLIFHDEDALAGQKCLLTPPQAYCVRKQATYAQ